MKTAKSGLGRGLGALMENSQNAAEESIEETKNTGALMVDIRKIEPNPLQPRQFFDEEALRELAESMKDFGIVQPLLVKDEGDFYSIIAGERRYRAARLAKLDEVPVLVKEYTEMETLQVALIENIQRQDLTSIEEAICYKRLMDDFFFSAEEVAQNLGKNKHAVISSLHLLELSDGARQFAAEGKLTASHAKALLSVEDDEMQTQVAKRVADNGLSVRETELFINNLLRQIARKAEASEAEPMSENMAKAYKRAENDLEVLLGSKVQIVPGKKKSKIEIEYYNNEDLERLLGIFRMIKHD